MIKTRINNEYKDIIKIFGGGALQKEITKVWSREANKYVYESSVEYTGTLPITINADGNALLGYRIYGSTEQTGTPTPSNPIMPRGCGERTENLCPPFTYQGVIQGTNGVYAPSTAYVSTEKFEIDSTNSEFVAGTVGKAFRIWGVAFYDENDEFISMAQGQNTSSLYAQIPANAQYAACTCSVNPAGQNTYPSDIVNSYLIYGSTAPDHYIPYGYKLPILSNSTVTNIYLGEVETTRRIKKVVLTGEERWYTAVSSTGLFAVQRFEPMQAQPFIPMYNALSNCYVFNPAQINIDISTVSGEFALQAVGTGITRQYHLFIKDGRYGGEVNDFKSYLAAQYAAGTPVTVWYVLAEPETGIVNEPLMKIGNYADTLSMEQADVSIPTFAGTTVIDYDGEPKPSEMYIKYRR